MNPTIMRIIDEAKKSYQRYKNHMAYITYEEKMEDKNGFLIGEGVELSAEEDPRTSPIHLDDQCFFPLLKNTELSQHFSKFIRTLYLFSAEEKLSILNHFHSALEEIDALKKTTMLPCDTTAFSDIFTEKLSVTFGCDQESPVTSKAMKRM